MIKKITIIFTLFVTAITVHSQSTCIYLTDNRTYKNADGGAITFYESGKVAIDGKIDSNFSFYHEDCKIDLYYKGKLINTLTHSAGYYKANYECDCLIDKRKIIYHRK